MSPKNYKRHTYILNLLSTVTQNEVEITLYCFYISEMQFAHWFVIPTIIFSFNLDRKTTSLPYFIRFSSKKVANKGKDRNFALLLLLIPISFKWNGNVLLHPLWAILLFVRLSIDFECHSILVESSYRASSHLNTLALEKYVSTCQ